MTTIDPLTAEALARFGEAVDTSFSALARSLEALAASLESERKRFDAEMAELRDELIAIDHRVAAISRTAHDHISGGELVYLADRRQAGV